MMIYELLPYYTKLIKEYKTILNVNIHVTISVKP